MTWREILRHTWKSYFRVSLAGGIEVQKNEYTTTAQATGIALKEAVNVVELNHATVVIAATIAASDPKRPTKFMGRRLILKDTSASGTAAHTVTLPTGVTFDGTNNTATLNAPGEQLIVDFISETEAVIVQNTGAVGLSAV